MFYFEDFLTVQGILTDEQLGQLFRALMEFSLSFADREAQIPDVVPDPDAGYDTTVKLMYGLIGQKTIRDAKQYWTTCTQNAENRAKRGHKGKGD